MSASVTEPRDKKRAAGRQAIIYLCIALFCGLFAAIYEHFSHGVYSPFMALMFLFPLAFGAAAALCFLSKVAPSPAVRELYAFGAATLTVGSCITGVFEIYGTTAPLVSVYWYAGALLTGASAVLYAVSVIRRR